MTIINIPDSVTTIGNYAFSGCSSLSSINIPDSVTTIGNYAFEGCSSLTSVDLPDSVTTIGSFAFYNCKKLNNINIPNSVNTIEKATFGQCVSLTSINIPDSVTSIREHAFSGCSKLASINIPDSVTTIVHHAFKQCTSLKEIKIPKSVTSIDLEAFNECYSLTKLYIEDLATCITASIYLFIPARHDIYLNDTKIEKIVIPDGTINIGTGLRNSTISSVELPNSVTTIGNDAFSGCSSLSSINIPNSVTTIGNSAFYGCKSLSSINIPDSVTTIGSYTFSGCSGLLNINIPDSVTTIGSYAFYNCENLNNINVPNSLTTIGYNAFNGCTSLSSINIPDSVTTIGSYAFYNCENLNNINIPNSLTTIGNSAFYRCTSLSSINIPNSVTLIGSYAFYGCTSLTSIHIPDSVSKIYLNMFQNCNNLISMTIGSEVDTIDLSSRYSTMNSLKVVQFKNSSVPSILYGSYTNNSSIIKDMFSTQYLKSLNYIVVPNESKQDYIEAWGTLIPDTVSIISASEYEEINIIPSKIRDVSVTGETNRITVTWTISKEIGTTNYVIYRSDDQGVTFNKIGIVKDRTKTTYVDTNVTEGNEYQYYVIGMNDFNTMGSIDEASIVSVLALSDKEQPQIISLSPQTGDLVNGVQNIKVNATDNTGVTKVQIYGKTGGTVTENDNTEWSLLGELTNLNESFKLDTTQYLDGEYSIQAIAYDRANNASDPVTHTIIIDNTGPEKVKKLYGNPSSVGVSLHWEDVADNDRKLYQVEILKDGEYQLYRRVETIGTNIQSGLTPDTEYTFRVVAYDNLGNRGVESDPCTIKTLKDTTKPVIKSYLPEAGFYSSVIPLKVGIMDDHGISKVIIQISYDKTNWNDLGDPIIYETIHSSVTVNRDIDTQSLQKEIVDDADYLDIYIRAIAYDPSGNESITTDDAPFIQYRIDCKAPEEPKEFSVEGDAGFIQLSWQQGEEEDLSGYNIYRSTDGTTFTLLASNQKYISYKDYSVTANTTYYYKITAIDNAGNESIESIVLSAKPVLDTEAPLIVSITPEQGVMGKANNTIKIEVSDNWKLNSMEISYSINDGPSVIVGNHLTSAKNLTVNQVIPLNECSDGDEVTVTIQVTDLQGLNTTQSVTYTIDLAAPQVNDYLAVADQDYITISWTGNQESDLVGYKIYRVTDHSRELIKSFKAVSDTSEYSYKDYNTNPRTYYTYDIETWDNYGNTNVFTTNQAMLLSNRVKAVITLDSTIVVDTQYYIDATSTQSADQIVSYQFDFGDGQTLETTNPKPIHKYESEGSYTIQLTVTDEYNNTSTVEKVINVVQKIDACTLTVKAVDADGKPLKGVEIFYDLTKSTDNVKKTNENGMVTFESTGGNYVIGAYYGAEYLPINKEVSMISGVDKTVELTMVHEPVVAGNFETKRMTLQEIKDAGIDIGDCASQEFVQTDIKVMFGEKEVKLVVISDNIGSFNYLSVVKEFVEEEEIRVIKPLKNKKVEEEINAPQAALVAILDVPVDATFTKEFFDVKLHIINNSGKDFELTDNVVTLELPEGLTLIETSTSDSKVTSFDSLKGQQVKTIQYVIRGDKAGEYDLSALYQGFLKNFDRMIETKFTTMKPLKVYGMDAVNLTADIQGKVKDQQLAITLGVKNVTTDTTVNGLQFDLSDSIIKGFETVVLANGQIILDDGREMSITKSDEYILSQDGTRKEAGEEVNLEVGEGYYKTYIIDIGSDMAVYAKYLQAVILDTQSKEAVDIVLTMDGLELQHDFGPYVSNNDATCIEDGTKTAVCLNGCGKTHTIKDKDSHLTAAHDYENGYCKLCNEIKTVTVTFFNFNQSPANTKQYQINLNKEDIQIVSGVYLDGYDYKGLKIGNTIYSDEATARDAIYKMITTTYDDVKVYQTYEQINESYTVSLENGTFVGYQNVQSKEFPVSNVVVVQSNTISGKKFSHWEKDGVIVSYTERYSFPMPRNNISLKAVFVEDTEAVDKLGTATIETVTPNKSTGKISFVALLSVPDKCKIVYGGVVATSNEAIANEGLTDQNAMYVKKATTTKLNLKYTWTKGNVGTQTWYVRAYLVYKDENGVSHTIYGDLVKADINGIK